MLPVADSRYQDLKADAFAENQIVCMSCKRKLDNIYKQAKSQGQLDWFVKARADDQQVFRMLDSYSKAGAEAERLKLKKTKWNLSQYKESIIAKSGTDFVAHGELMWERQAIEFWQSTSGGRLSEEAAKAQWDDWARNKEKLNVIFDYNGPNKSAPLRLRIPVKDAVNFVNSYAREKRNELLEAAVKKPGQEDVDKNNRRCLVDHDKIGNGSGEPGLTSIAQGMVTSGDGSSFDGNSILLADVRQLAPEDVASEEEEEAEEGGGFPDNTTDAGSEPAAKRAKIWFDRDRLCNQSRKDLQTAFDKVKQECTGLLKKLEADIRKVEAEPIEVQRHFDGELRIGKTRLKAMQLVCYGEAQHLSEFILTFSPLTVGTGKLGAASSSDPTASLGLAPPCQGYQDLTLLVEWEAMIDGVLDCENAASLKEKKRAFLSCKGPFLSLIGACKKACGDFDKVRKALASAEQRGKQTQVAAAAAVAAGASKLAALFDAGADLALPLQYLQEGSGEVVDFSAPIAASADPQKLTAFTENLGVKSFLETFRTSFQNDPMKVLM